LFSLPGGVLDPSSDALYVVDTGNHRILRFDDRASLSASSVPSFIIGQRTLSSVAPNAGRNSTSTFGLDKPLGAYMDSQGHLWVADADNNRVMLFAGVTNATVNDINATIELWPTRFPNISCQSRGGRPNSHLSEQPRRYQCCEQHTMGCRFGEQ